MKHNFAGDQTHILLHPGEWQQGQLFRREVAIYCSIQVSPHRDLVAVGD